MKRLFFVLFVQLAALSLACAQKLVPQFTQEAYDLTAQSQPRVDLNGRTCALVKVLFVGDIVGVDGNIVGETVRHTNELWVYMPMNSMHLKVVTKDYLPLLVTFSDYGIEGLESGKTYVLALAKSGDETTTPPSATSSAALSSSADMSGSTITIPVNDNVSIEMVRVEAGSFMMGTWTDNKNDTVHKVTLTKNYYIGKYEVTQALWQAVMGENTSWFKGDNLPAGPVGWDDCQEFISMLNKLTGLRFRLPTEAEWEYAARGGNKSRSYQFSGSNTIDDVAWHVGNSGNKIHAVGTKKANELGLYDMSGNALEWCQDWYGRYDGSSQTNPTGAQSGAERVQRGGCWFSYGRSCRVSYRSCRNPGGRCHGEGFRLCLSE